VAIAAVPHFFGTAIRCWTLRKAIDRRLLGTFGWLGAVGSLIGALLHSVIGVMASSMILSAVLIAGGIWGLSSFGDRFRLPARLSHIAGALSGVLGGLVGNQGGIRAIALLPFNLEKHAFIATSTAIALLVDLSRVPVYFYADGSSIIEHVPLVSLCTVAVVVGTLAGSKVTLIFPQSVFPKVVAIAVLILGISKVFPVQTNFDKRSSRPSVLVSDNDFSSLKAKLARRMRSDD
jgi:uncharacterized protein